MNKLFIYTLLAFCCLQAVTLAQTPDATPNTTTEDQVKLGLWTLDGQALLLTELSSNVNIQGNWAAVHHSQVYQNQFETEVEVIFHYSKGKDTLITGFNASWQNDSVQAILMDEAEAKYIFDNYNSSEVEGSPNDSKKTSAFVVGKVPANASITIHYSVIQSLYAIANQYYGFSLYSSLLESVDLNTQSWNNSANLSQNYQNRAINTTWKVEVTTNTISQLTKALNPTHNIEPTYNKSGTSHYAKWSTNIDLAKDFVIFFTHAKIDQPDYIFTKHPSIPADWTFSFSFLPKLNNIDSNEIAAALLNGSTVEEVNKMTLSKDFTTASGEYIFLIDASVNVSEATLDQIKTAVGAFLNKLPARSIFNIVVYGADQVSVYKSTSQTYYSKAIKDASTWISKLAKPASGNSTLLDALTYIANNITQNKYYPRTVFLLAASQPEDDGSILKQVFNTKEDTRYCAIGVNQTNNTLFENIGYIGSCGSQAVADGEKIEEKALDLFNRAISPFIKDIKINFWCNNTKGEIIQTHEETDGFIIKGQPYTKSIFMRNLEDAQGCKANFTFMNSFTNVIYTKSYNFKGFSLAVIDDTWHKIAAESVMEELEKEILGTNFDENLVLMVMELSVYYGVESKYTKWISYHQASGEIIKDSIIALFKEPKVDNSTDNSGELEGEDGEGVENGEDGENGEDDSSDYFPAHPRPGNHTNCTNNTNNTSNTTPDTAANVTEPGSVAISNGTHIRVRATGSLSWNLTVIVNGKIIKTTKTVTTKTADGKNVTTITTAANSAATSNSTSINPPKNVTNSTKTHGSFTSSSTVIIAVNGKVVQATTTYKNNTQGSKNETTVITTPANATEPFDEGILDVNAPGYSDNYDDEDTNNTTNNTDTQPTQPVDPSTQPADPNAQPADPNTQPSDPNAQPADPNTQPDDSNAQPSDPNTQPTQPVDPNTQPVDPNAQPVDPNTQPDDSNAQPADPNTQPADSNAQPADPNTQPDQPVDPNAQPVDPNTQPADPNAQPADGTLDVNAPGYSDNVDPVDTNNTAGSADAQPADPNSQPADNGTLDVNAPGYSDNVDPADVNNTDANAQPVDAGTLDVNAPGYVDPIDPTTTETVPPLEQPADQNKRFLSKLF